jgi:hypothetical protein
MTRLPRSPGSTLILRLNQETVNDFVRYSGHHAARTWPPGPSNQAYLSSPHLESSTETIFRPCSSPAPTPVKPQPAPAILAKSQSTPRCQSLITPGSDHPPVLEPHGLSKSSISSNSILKLLPPAFLLKASAFRNLHPVTTHPYSCRESRGTSK